MTEVEGVATWEDVHRLSVLDTDWLSMQMGSLFTVVPSSGLVVPNPWEEMEQRHEAERKEILGWCEKPDSSNLMAASDDDDDTYYCGDGSSGGYGSSDD
ncbi:hypothetical protein FS749_000153 [Ceratobasidium sp. UAMH 11750]|nr:hypothetical protein FS749_000153 [Ceratobasidium sp. UAMH 11750]